MMIRLIYEILIWILVQALRRSKYVWITGAMGLRFSAFLIIKPLEEESLIHNFLAVSMYALAAFSSYYIPLRIYEWFDEQLKGMEILFDHELVTATLVCRLFCRSVTATFMPLLSLYMGSSKEYEEDLVCWVFSLWAGSVVLISYGTMTADDYGVADALIGIVLPKLIIGSNFLMVWVAVLLLITQASRIIIIPIIINFNVWYGDPPCPRVWDPDLPISNPSCTTNRPRDQTYESPRATTSEAPQSPTPQSSPPAEQTYESPPATTLEAPRDQTPQSSPRQPLQRHHMYNLQLHSRLLRRIKSPPATTLEEPQSPTPHSSPRADQTVV
ncbi:hypothetical protein ACJIZ3_009393 [Penstemon smallii]|uniref:Transmembrane protein n=1 Tax=Penstemon smallii TaxID=265156 RepID=A0ABD3TCW6_9LAMI